MNELEISYGISNGKKIFSIIVGAYSALYGFYHAILLALNNDFTFTFYLALVAVVLGVILILSVTLWKPKPMFKMDSDSIYINIPSLKSVYSAEWISIKEIGIGVSYLKFSETDGKDYHVDISDLKYSDLKLIKSKIIETCEAKSIPYRND